MSSKQSQGRLSARTDSNPWLLVLGGTSELGFACARRFAHSGYNVCLAGRDGQLLRANAGDLSLRYGAATQVVEFDALDPDTHDRLFSSLTAPPEVVLVTIGRLGNQLAAEQDRSLTKAMVDTNLTGPINLLNGAARLLQSRGGGTLIGVSSIAGSRGRGGNFIYGAAKAGLTAYLSGLRNKLYEQGIHVITVIPGYLDTRMTADINTPSRLTLSAEHAAERIYHAFRKRRNVTYLSLSWWAISLAIRAIPESWFKRMRL